MDVRAVPHQNNLLRRQVPESLRAPSAVYQTTPLMSSPSTSTFSMCPAELNVMRSGLRGAACLDPLPKQTHSIGRPIYNISVAVT